MAAPEKALPAQPVPEPEPDARARDELAKLMYKQPLDPIRKIPAAPVEQADRTLPTAGVRQGLPVVYGARAEPVAERSGEPLELEQRIGAPAAGAPVIAQQREGLPSMVKLNRRFRIIALGGGTVVILVVTAGLWVIARLAFG